MNSNWQHKIRQHEATPPGDAWNNITSMLDAPAGFAGKLAAFESIPPESAQKNIFALLDASGETQDSFPVKVYEYEINAPDGAWPNIVAALEKDTARVLPLQPQGRRIQLPYLRIAAGVILLAVISLGIWLISPDSKPGTPESTASAQPKSPIKPAEQNNITGNSSVSFPAQPKSIAATSQNTTGQTNHSRNVQYVQDEADFSLVLDPAQGNPDKLQAISGETPQDISAMNANSGYVVTAGPDGEQVRISVKLSNYIRLLTEKDPKQKENIDLIIEESAKWRAIFAEWRERMINNAVAPSITNFMDIIELSNILEEKK
ncbi:MAG: hypothetical protein U0V75_08820 [Ferruginibacter sp.]